MSIVRIGLAETNKFGEGYDAIFGKKKKKGPSARKPATAKKKARNSKRVKKK